MLESSLPGMASIESRPLLQGIAEPESGAHAHRVELLTYGQRQPAYRTSQQLQLTVAELLEEAARIKYGRRIRFLYTSATEAQLQRFWDNLRISIRPVDTEPREVGRSVIDITTKDYVNSGSEKDESIVEICKPAGVAKGTSAEWYVQNGLTWSVSSNIGTNIMRLAAMVPVRGTVGAMGSITQQKLTQEALGHSLSADTLSFTYKREEKVVVPPRSKVTVTITSYAIRYSFHYTLQFSALQSEEISIKFRTKFQDYWGGCCLGCCLGCCVSSGIITARELLTAMPLPGFSEDSNWVRFTQDGVLSWVGDGSKVQKIEHPLS